MIIFRLTAPVEDVVVKPDAAAGMADRGRHGRWVPGVAERILAGAALCGRI